MHATKDGETLQAGCSIESIAAKHGVDFNSVVPHTIQERLQQLRAVLDNKAVPHPIDPERSRAYFELAASGVPFGIGSLTDGTVNLEKYTCARLSVADDRGPSELGLSGCRSAGDQTSICLSRIPARRTDL